MSHIKEVIGHLLETRYFTSENAALSATFHPSPDDTDALIIGGINASGKASWCALSRRGSPRKPKPHQLFVREPGSIGINYLCNRRQGFSTDG